MTSPEYASPGSATVSTAATNAHRDAMNVRPQRKTGTAASDITSACSTFSSEYPSVRSPSASGSPATAGTTAL